MVDSEHEGMKGRLSSPGTGGSAHPELCADAAAASTDNIGGETRKDVQPGMVNPSGRIFPGRIFTIPEDINYLDSERLEALTETFRRWRNSAVTLSKIRARGRITLTYLLLRYTGARLGEVLALNESEDIDLRKCTVRFRARDAENSREVQLPVEVCREIEDFLAGPATDGLRNKVFRLDQGYVRRKFYERGREAGLPKELANPMVLRRSRAIELLRNNIPLSVVQAMLGHATVSQTASYVDFSEKDTQRIISDFILRESGRRTSARNAFYGKITKITKGDIQSEIELTTSSGYKVYSIITNESLAHLELHRDMTARAIIKAPWVIVGLGGEEPKASARNKFMGKVAGILKGKVTSEVLVELGDGTIICAIVTLESVKKLKLGVGDAAWVMFKAFSVIIEIE